MGSANGLTRPCACLCERYHPAQLGICDHWATSTHAFVSAAVAESISIAACDACGAASYLDLSRRAGEELAKWQEEGRGVGVNLTVNAAMTLITLLQRACALPDTDAASRQMARDLANMIADPLVNGHPAVKAWIDRGWGYLQAQEQTGGALVVKVPRELDEAINELETAYPECNAKHPEIDRALTKLYAARAKLAKAKS